MSEIVSRDEYVSLMKDVAQNAANISTIMNHVEGQRSDTKKILSYIENDPNTGRLGLFATQLAHDERIEKIEDERASEKAKQKVYIGVATAVGGYRHVIGNILIQTNSRQIMKAIKTFLAIYFPIFIGCGIWYHFDKSKVWLVYPLSAITLAALAWLVYKMKFKK